MARRDRFIPLSVDQFNTQIDMISEYWATAKVAYVFDNTRDVALNIRYGTRFRVFAEHYEMVYRDNGNDAPANLSVFGFDFRHYQKIHREIIGVARIAGSRVHWPNAIDLLSWRRWMNGGEVINSIKVPQLISVRTMASRLWRRICEGIFRTFAMAIISCL